MTSEEKILQKLLAQQSESIARHQLKDGRSVWVRRVNRGNPKIYYNFQTFIARFILKAPPLRAVFRGPGQAIEDEASRLAALAAAEIPAPHLLAQLPEGLMMSDLGAGHEQAETLDGLMHDQAAEGKPVLPLWCAGLDALSDVHDKQQYLSQAFARNIMLLDGKDWAFIDFEEDPIHELSLEQCQVRDLLFYLHSTVFMINDKKAAVAYFRQALRDADPALQGCFHQTAIQLANTRLRALIGKLGRDGRRIAEALDFIEKSAVSR